MLATSFLVSRIRVIKNDVRFLYGLCSQHYLSMVIFGHYNKHVFDATLGVFKLEK